MNQLTSVPPPPPAPPSQPKKPVAFPDAQWFCYFIIGFTGYLFATNPTTVPAALIFRLSLMIGAAIGLVIIAMRKKKG